MFPLNSSTVFYLILTGVALLSTVAFQFRWKARAPLLLVALALPAGFLWSAPPIVQHAGLHVLVLVPSAAALIIGAGCGSFMRLAQIRWSVSVLVPAIIAIAFSGYQLWLQYVPSSCLKTPLQVRIAGETLNLPWELSPRLERGEDIYLFGRLDKKADFSAICRMSRNGAEAIDMDVIWITPAANYSHLTSVCAADGAPNWCSGYSPTPYRHIGKVLIAPVSETDLPPTYWAEGGSLKAEQQGSLTEGAICPIPQDWGNTECSVWQPFGNGSRLTVRTNNRDPIFNGMPPEQARKMARHGLKTTLSIVTP